MQKQTFHMHECISGRERGLHIDNQEGKSDNNMQDKVTDSFGSGQLHDILI